MFAFYVCFAILCIQYCCADGPPNPDTSAPNLEASVIGFFDALHSALSSQLMGPSLAMAVAGVAGGLAYGLLNRAQTAVANSTHSSLHIELRSEAHTWVLLWLTKLGKTTPPRHGNLQVLDRSGNASLGAMYHGMGSNLKASESKTEEKTFGVVPADGTYFHFWYKGYLVWAQRQKDQSQMRDGGVQGGITLSVLAPSNAILLELVNEARLMDVDRLKSQTEIWMASAASSSFMKGMQWKQVGTRPSRPFESVLLDGGIADNLLQDCRTFLSSVNWYSERGIPHRRGYLLHGPPGCGKTSYIMALAGELRLTICIVNLSSPTMTDDTLLQLLNDAPGHCIILLEDIDAAFRSEVALAPKPPPLPDDEDAVPMPPGMPMLPGMPGMQARTSQMASGVSFSGLLNAVDGVAAQEGRLLFMTTNHPELLDEALVRPGRVDRRVKFDLASTRQIRSLFLKFFANSDTLPADQLEANATAFAKAVPPHTYSMAKIQGFLMLYRDDPKAAVVHVADMDSADASLMHAAISRSGSVEGPLSRGPSGEAE